MADKNLQAKAAREKARTRLSEMGAHGDKLYDNALFAEATAQAAIALLEKAERFMRFDSAAERSPYDAALTLLRALVEQVETLTREDDFCGFSHHLACLTGEA